MRTPLALCLVIALSISVTLSAQDSMASALHASYTDAFENENMDNMMKLYTNDAVVRNADGSMVKGHDEIKGSYEAFFEMNDATISLEEVEETKLGNNHLFVSGTFMFKSGDMSQKGMFVNTLVKKDGKWKMLRSYRFNMP